MNAARKRPGFTLVELLVVIGIIAVLVALLTPVVMQSLTKSRNAAIKAEIDMLHMAIMNYKNEYGSFPPCFDSQFVINGNTYVASGEAAKHLARLFPRCTAGTTQLNTVAVNSAGNRVNITPLTALVAWLSGYTADPTSPLLPAANRKKLFDFDSSRMNLLDVCYFPSGKQAAPYIYIDKNFYVGSLTNPLIVTSGTYFAHRVPAAGTTVWNAPLQPAFNPDTFQILCAGRDEEFGNDDDLSNFWPGTRREYLDSLKD